MVEKPDKDEDVKTKAQALFLARGSASHIVHVLTNNKHLVDEAFKFASVKSSSSGDAESSGQDQEEEGGDGDDIEEDSQNNNNDNDLANVFLKRKRNRKRRLRLFFSNSVSK